MAVGDAPATISAKRASPSLDLKHSSCATVIDDGSEFGSIPKLASVCLCPSDKNAFPVVLVVVVVALSVLSAFMF